MDMDYDALDRLGKLRDSGAITDDEFASRKAILLNADSTEEEYEARGNFPERAKVFLTRTEGVYLAVLRAATLIFATILVAYAAWLGISGLYNVSRNVASVKEEPVVVAVDEVAKVDLDAPIAAQVDQKVSPAPSFDDQRTFYKTALDQYYRLFKASFEKYRKDDDKVLSKPEFDKVSLNTEARIASLKSNEFDFTQDRADVTSLIKVMTEVAVLPETQQRLVKYKNAKRQRVEEKINRTRDETYCSYFGYYIDQCITYDTRQVKYTETKVSMRLPAGVVSHTDLITAYQRKFLDTLLARREASRQKADSERHEILAANARGEGSLRTAIAVAGGFLVLMFFFLLIAIERHQRKLAAD